MTKREVNKLIAEAFDKFGDYIDMRIPGPSSYGSTDTERAVTEALSVVRNEAEEVARKLEE